MSKNSQKAKHQPLPRAIRLPPEAPVFLIEDWELPNLTQIPSGKELPFSGFVDVRGRVHFEVNYWSYLPSKSVLDFMRWAIKPHLYLKDLCLRITEKSLLKGERQLLGGFVGTFHSVSKSAKIYYIGLLPPGVGVPMQHEIRQKAFDKLVHEMDRLLQWMGADSAETTPCVISEEKMKRIGWSLKPLSWTQHLRMLKHGFPLSVRLKPRIYTKKYGMTQLGSGEDSIISTRGELQAFNRQPEA